MSVIGIVLMWGLFAAAIWAMGRWSMGKESDRRQKYWAKYTD